MKRFGKFALCTLFALVSIRAFAGCSAMKPEDFRDTTPRFQVEQYFAGETNAYGMFFDRFGRVKRQFTVQMTGAFEGQEFVLREKFFYTDGEKEERVWRITEQDEHSYEGRAADVVGHAVGRAFGQALQWRYALNLKVDDSTLRVNFDDWMFLQPDNVLINRAVMSKFGIKIGEVLLVFHKPSSTPTK